MYGHTDVHDEQHSGRASVLTETFAKVEQEMLEDRRVTVRSLCKWIPEVSKSGGRVLREGYMKNTTAHAKVHRL